MGRRETARTRLFVMLAAAALLTSSVQALVPGAVMRASAPTRASPQMSEQPMGRREIISKVLGSAALVSATAANADIDYAGVGFLGGSSTIDVNNANIRVYTKVSPARTHRETREAGDLEVGFRVKGRAAGWAKLACSAGQLSWGSALHACAQQAGLAVEHWRPPGSAPSAGRLTDLPLCLLAAAGHVPGRRRQDCVERAVQGQGGHVLQVRIHRGAVGGHQEVRRQVHLPGAAPRVRH